MSRLLRLCALLLLGAFAVPAAAQRVVTYTQSQTGTNLLTYGLPVPLPIDSLTPVDGFRSYASLEARLQSMALESSDLSAHDIGRTTAGRTHWAYVVSDEDGNDVEGRPEAAFFINATTHAREWGAPEVSTGTIERLIAGAGDAGITRYLLDNTRLVIIPVHNIDGLLQSQRYPTQAIIGQDPGNPTTWPRDGRMRRKNMRGADENLLTFADHLNGVDLNRNHPPFWATSIGQGGSSSDPAALTFHGSGPHSEVENQALRAAAQLAPATRIRLGIDVHSYSRVFFSSNTARTRLNTIQSGLLVLLQEHHFGVANKFYQEVPDPPNRGIGTAAEYFAYEWLVPAWTLELEPQNSPVEYGGLSVNHGGFILPASQARRVREGWAETHHLAFYAMAGPPHLRRVRVYDVQSNALVLETRWEFDPVSGRRQRVTALPGPLLRGARYRLELGFSKPMRYRDAAGNVASLPGVPHVPLGIGVALLRGSASTALDTNGGQWLTDPARVLRYRDDTFAFEFTAPDESVDLGLRVEANDMAGQRLDSDPATPADWSAGAWSEWEDSNGADGDFGGADNSTTLRVATALPIEIAASSASGGVVGEGDTLTLRLRRPTAGSERIVVQMRDMSGAGLRNPVTVATWEPGVSGERDVVIAVTDDLVVQGDTSLLIDFSILVDGTVGATLQRSYALLDNDASDLGVLRARDSTTLAVRWNDVRSGASARQLVLDGDESYVLPEEDGGSPPRGLLPVESNLTLSGNGASFELRGGARAAPFLQVASSGTLHVDHARLRIEEATTLSPQVAVANAGRLVLSRIKAERIERADGVDVTPALVLGEGRLEIRRSLVRGIGAGLSSPLVDARGQGLISASTFSEAQGSPLVGTPAAGFAWNAASLIGNITGFHLLGNASPPSTSFGHALLQRNAIDQQISPGTGRYCDQPGVSLGFNIEATSSCGFVRGNDRQATDLGAQTFDSNAGGYLPIGIAIDGGAAAAEAAATGCGPVDQRGAPRPQSRTAGATPRCDIGAIELGINPYRGIWQPTRNGHGVELHTSGNQLLLVWYTYGDDGQPTSYQAAAPLTGPHWEADLLLPRRNVQTGVVTAPRVGRVSIDFSSDTDAQLGWRFDARGTTGTERIRPALFATGEPRFEVSGVWYPPAESGYGATVTRRGEVTALVLYYYDAAGNIRWVLGSSNGADALEIPMSSFTGFCPDCDAAAMPVTFRPAGSVVVHFQTPTRARLDTTVTYPGAAGGSWNRQRAALVPLNDPVDNRAMVPVP